jgi:uncharacterized protein
MAHSDEAGAGGIDDDDTAAETDAGPREAQRLPTRTCIVTRKPQPVDGLIRFVRGPNGAAVPDLAQRLPGRGVWITSSATVLLQAVEKKLFSRAFKAETRAGATLVDDVRELLKRRALQGLSLANKSGRLVAGFEKVLAALDNGKVAILISAADGAADGIGKLSAKARAIAASGGRRAHHITLFTADELSLSLGRSRVIHACLEVSGVTNAVLRDCARLAGYLECQTATDPKSGLAV